MTIKPKKCPVGMVLVANQSPVLVPFFTFKPRGADLVAVNEVEGLLRAALKRWFGAAKLKPDDILWAWAPGFNEVFVEPVLLSVYNKMAFGNTRVKLSAEAQENLQYQYVPGRKVRITSAGRMFCQG